jgi:hypothetical protein
MRGLAFALRQSSGWQFRCPDNWEIDDSSSADGVSIAIQSDGVSFGFIGVYSGAEHPVEVIEQVLESLREEHPALEVEDLGAMNWKDAAAAEAVFFSLDFITYCWIRSGRIANRTVVVYWQTIEPELATSREAFEVLCQSLARVRPAARRSADGAND